MLRHTRLEGLVRAGVEPHEALASHLPAEEPVCRHVEFSAEAPWADRLTTLLTTRMNPATLSFSLAAGLPCTAPFEPVSLPTTTLVSTAAP
jgi:hypothetical protein